MVSLVQAFNRLQSVKILVIGDLVLDHYTIGLVNRISPEAPVPVLHVLKTESIIGAAGNVASNLLALGSEVTLVGQIGDDKVGVDFIELMQKMGLSTRGIFTQNGIKTALKNRFIAQGQQLMRADYEEFSPISFEIEKKAKEFIQKEIGQMDVVAISDYGKGFLSTSLIQFVIQEASKFGIRVIVDPKGNDFTKYTGAYMIKPNQKEAFIAASIDEVLSIEEVASKLLNMNAFEYLLITRSEEGMTLFSNESEKKHFPVVKKNVIDVTGAGDTALAMIAFGQANGLKLEHTIELANISSGIAVERVGCASIKISEIMKVLLEKDPSGKIYKEVGESFVFQRSVENHPIILMNLGVSEEISVQIFSQIREAAREKKDAKLVVLIESSEKNKDFIHFLASMHEVDFILSIKDLYLESIIERLQPKEVWSGL